MFARHCACSLLPVVLSMVVLAGQAEAQLTQVNVMPGAPHATRTDPYPARPGQPTLVWGNCNSGSAVAIGWSYSWSFSANPNVAVANDGSLSGFITDPRFIVEEVTFTLLGASTYEVIDATLTVNDGSVTKTDMVQIQIIDPTDALSTPQTASLQIDVNIAIENGLRRLYLSQLPSGAWPGSAPCSETAFALWCFGNKGHRPTSPVADDDDIYAEFVQRGLDYLFSGMVAAGTTATRADLARGAIAAGVSDLNGNGRSINPCPTSAHLGYEAPIITSAIIASLSPGRFVTVGPFAGETYKTVVEDLVDFAGVQQNSVPVTDQRGGWDYFGPSLRSDYSIASWYFVALEGAEQTNYSIPVPDWIKQESEYSLVYHQTNAAGPQLFGYTSTAPLVPIHGRSTTSAGLSGLSLVESETSVIPGTIIAFEPPPLNTITAKRQAALDRLGDAWDVDSAGGLGEGNRGNFYTMWNTARALRITRVALGLLPGTKVPLVNGGVTFDWEFGEETTSPGIVPGFGLGPSVAGPAREGLFNWLVRNQDNSNANLTLRGQWDEGTFIASWYGPTYETSLGTLVLIPEVFGSFGCADVLNLEARCDVDATGAFSGTWTVTFDITNNSGVPVTNIVVPATTTVPGPPVTVGPNVFPQSPPLAPGDTASLSLVVTGGTGGEQVCFQVGLLDEDFEECCGRELCVTLPNCDCGVISGETIECDPTAAGCYNYTFTITNLSTITAENTFFLGAPTLPAGVSFSPATVSYPPLAPGASTTISTTICGATPGQLCFQVTLHDAALVDCCAVQHCIVLPDCGSSCLTDLECKVVGGHVELTWTPPTDDQCCQDLRLELPDGSQVPLPDPFAGFYAVSGPCMPGDYCLTCVPDPAIGLPPTVVCCSVSQDDCNPDPCLSDLTCELTADGLLLTWTPTMDPDCCVEMDLTYEGIALGSIDPAAGSYLVVACHAGTYCVTCYTSVGIPGTTQCCTIDQACNPILDPVLTSDPVLVATADVPYEYDVDGYMPGLDPTPIQYILVAGPPSATINPDDGLLQWLPGAGDVGDQPFTIVARAGLGQALQSWVVAVSSATPAVGAQVPFIRGDCSGDGGVDIGDAVVLLGQLFDGLAGSTCSDACDVNDSGGLDISDAIFLLAHLFTDGAAPPVPFDGGCGQDPTSDDLDCFRSIGCE